MSYPHRYHIFARADKLTAANNAAASWDPDTGGGKTFGAVKLSASGAEPASHYGCSTQATDAMRDKMLQAVSSVPLYKVYRESDGWTWETALVDVGLQRVLA